MECSLGDCKDGFTVAAVSTPPPSPLPFAELPHLAEAIERALNLLHVAVSLSAEHYNNTELLNALIAERGSGAGRHSLVLTILRYIALEDEPRLAGAALELAMIVGRERDSEVYQVMSPSTPSLRRGFLSTLSCVLCTSFPPTTS